MKKQKKDLIPLVLYKLMYDKYIESRKLLDELNEYLIENYKPKKVKIDSKGEDYSVEDTVNKFTADSIYGNEEEVEKFLRSLSKEFIRK